VLTTYRRAGALFIGGLAVQLLGFWFVFQLDIFTASVMIFGMIVAAVVLGVVSAVNVRTVEVVAGFVGVVSGAILGTPNDYPVALFAGLPYLAGAIPAYVYVLARARERAPR
jgi:hypothetical protein